MGKRKNKRPSGPSQRPISESARAVGADKETLFEDSFDAEESEHEAEFLSLKQKFFDDAASQEMTDPVANIDSGDEDEYIENLEMEDEEARDAWGRRTRVFYVHDSEMSSESDDSDDDRVQQQLQEARQIRQQQLSSLSLRELNAGFSDLLQSTESTTPNIVAPGLNDDAVALQMILNSAATQKHTLQTNETSPLDFLPEFAATYKTVLADVQKESVLYLKCKTQSQQLPKLSESAIGFLDLQLRLCLWFTSVLQTCQLFGSEVPPTVLAMAELVIKATKKLRKIRKQFGEVMFKKLRRLLAANCWDVVSTTDDGADADMHLDLAMLDEPTRDVEEDTDYADKEIESSEEESKLNRAELARTILEHEEALKLETERSRLEALRPQSKRQPTDVNHYGDPVAVISEEYKEKELETQMKAEEKKNKPLKTQAKKETSREKSLAHLPKLPKEVEGAREISRDIEKNRGLTRKRKKYEGHARVHNRLKYARKLKKLSGVTRKADVSGAANYAGEASGISAHVRRSLRLT
eukprot:Gregarina_sp_Poly_1__2928@NODE_1819_length_3275_cov_85_079177_g1180_i0_p1_GENE_NODE_1819_length_3275_cov_85_079177_g1180_i0NODE_1819_length_3275_cov_85_079177_g1180_i0_p1_ORF_typecomplete_len525_score106_40Sas10/PF09368_10/5_2e03Sas10/PF09368_10/2e20_NODE_1819_length_3275_cov_85_079177_g1180_i015533127